MSKTFSFLLANTLPIAICYCEEWSPLPEHPTLLAKAVLAMQDCKDSYYHARFIPEESRIIYYEKADFLGRVRTAAGYRYFFLLLRIVSGGVKPPSDVPPSKGGYVLAWFDNDMNLIGQRRDAAESCAINLENATIKINPETRDFDLRLRSDCNKIIGGAPFDERDYLGEDQVTHTQSGSPQPANGKPSPSGKGESRKGSRSAPRQPPEGPTPAKPGPASPQPPK